MNANAGWLEVNVAGGARVCVPASAELITPYVLLEQEDWFEDEIRFVRRWLRPGMRAVDVGANFGVYTLAIAQAIGGEGRVWAFEPTAGTAAALERSLERNALGCVEVIRAAVCDREGSVAFSVGPHSELNRIASATQGDAVQVPATTLDRASAQHRWGDVDFVKLDVEGHESAAIQGGAAFLQAGSPLVMLEVKAGPRDGGPRINLSPLEPLTELGYAVYRLLPGPLVLQPFEPHEAFDRYLLNVFACKEDRARSLAAAGYLIDSGAPHTAAMRRGAWSAFARSAPYARELASAWRSKPGWFSPSDVGTYFEGLEAFARSRAPENAAGERVAWLQRALACLADALQPGDTLARRISYARVATELGWRDAAVVSLQSALERLEAGETPAEPFLAPSARYEAFCPGARMQEWLLCALTEQFERLRFRSSIYAGTSSLEVLAPIRQCPFRSPEMDRRWNLVRAPEPLPLLQVRSEENLNPEIWSGAAWPAA